VGHAPTFPTLDAIPECATKGKKDHCMDHQDQLHAHIQGESKANASFQRVQNYQREAPASDTLRKLAAL
jgi:hypothetical protein